MSITSPEVTWDQPRFQPLHGSTRSDGRRLRAPSQVLSSIRANRRESKTHSLGKGKVGSVVDGVCRPAHVLLPGVGAGFATATSLLFPAKCAADLSPGRANVDVRDAAVGAGDGEEALGLT